MSASLRGLGAETKLVIDDAAAARDQPRASRLGVFAPVLAAASIAAVVGGDEQRGRPAARAKLGQDLRRLCHDLVGLVQRFQVAPVHVGVTERVGIAETEEQEPRRCFFR
jgi:hypothetical protein